MGKYEEKFVHEITVPFKYHREGNVVEAHSITINAPSNKVIPFTAVLEQEYSSAIISLTDKLNRTGNLTDDNKADLGATNDNALQTVMLLASGGGLQKCYAAFRNILTSGNTEHPTCVIDDTVKMTHPVYENMSPMDTKILLGKYIISFLGFSPGS